MNWFWNTIAKWFGNWHDNDYHPPTPDDRNAKGLGWHGDRPEDHEERKRQERIDRFHEGLNGGD
jgi:hypothetical protein